MMPLKTILLLIVLGSIVGAIIYLQSKTPRQVTPEAAEIAPPLLTMNAEIAAPVLTMNREKKARQYPVAKEITTPDGFINTERISVAEFIGKKIVLIDFWTYSCINCQRTIPHLNGWWEAYKDQGLLVIGVHTPEFEFEQKYDNVLAAVRKFGITYPVVLDNDYSTWHAYKNRYWPRKYLIDIDGFIVYDHIGEGGYEETEKKIQELLAERARVLGMNEIVETTITPPPNAPPVEFSQVKSPEVYFGAARNRLLGNGRAGVRGSQTFEAPEEVELNKLYLVGEWELSDEFAENKSANAKIIFRYHAKDVYFVASGKDGVTIEVRRDGAALGYEAGPDIKKNEGATVMIREDRLYHLIEDTGYSEHTLEIIIEEPGGRAFTFTFG